MRVTNLVCLVKGHSFSTAFTLSRKGFVAFECYNCKHETLVRSGRGRPRFKYTDRKYDPGELK